MNLAMPPVHSGLMTNGLEPTLARWQQAAGLAFARVPPLDIPCVAQPVTCYPAG